MKKNYRLVEDGVPDLLIGFLIFLITVAIVTDYSNWRNGKAKSSAIQVASDPMERSSYFDAFQPDSTFRVKSLENLTANGLTRAVVERSDGYIFSALVVRRPGPDVSDRVLMVGDFVELSKLSYPLSGLSGSHGIPVEIFVIRSW